MGTRNRGLNVAKMRHQLDRSADPYEPLFCEVLPSARKISEAGRALSDAISAAVSNVTIPRLKA